MRPLGEKNSLLSQLPMRTVTRQRPGIVPESHRDFSNRRPEIAAGSELRRVVTARGELEQKLVSDRKSLQRILQSVSPGPNIRRRRRIFDVTLEAPDRS
jgi:hypothetical protein